MVGRKRIELFAFSMSTRRSTNELASLNNQFFFFQTYRILKIQVCVLKIFYQFLTHKKGVSSGFGNIIEQGTRYTLFNKGILNDLSIELDLKS